MNRKYDLDYLQWLQKNARLYMAGLAVLTLLIVASWCLYMEPWQPQGQAAFWHSESDRTAAEQNTLADARPAAEPAVQDHAASSVPQPMNKTEQTDTADSEQPDTVLKEETQKEEAQEELQKEPQKDTGEITVDLLSVQNQLAGFSAPCSGELLSAYGFGYHPVYEDYRFCDHLCYQAGGGEVKAVADGVVQRVDLNGDWQLCVTCGAYQIRYQGLKSCTLQEGQPVKGGQIIGTAGEYLNVQVVKQSNR